MRIVLCTLLLAGSLASIASLVRICTRLKGKLRLGLAALSSVAAVALFVRSLSVFAGRALPDWWSISTTSAYAAAMIVFWLRLEGHLKNGG